MPDEVVEKKESKISKAVSEFGTFCYNSDEGTVLGRNAISWVKITGFYIIFYACLAGFFAICLTVMLTTLPKDKPQVIGRTNRPTISPTKKTFNTLDLSAEADLTAYAGEVLEFLKEYNDTNINVTEKAMIVDFNNFPDCAITTNNQTNYVKSEKGCIFMWINRLIDWIPGNSTVVQCDWDIGIAGTGNPDPDFLTLKLSSLDNINLYYPWLNKDANGKQPVWALQVTNSGSEEAGEAFVKCTIMDNGKWFKNSAYYIFTVKY